MPDSNNLSNTDARLLDAADYPSFPCANCDAHVQREAVDPRNPEFCKACNDRRGWECGCCGNLTGGIDQFGQAYCGCENEAGL